MFAANYAQSQVIDQNAEIHKETHLAKKVVIIRNVSPEDVTLIQDMHDRLTGESVYFRYLGSNKPSRADLVQFCSSNGGSGTVLVATVREAEEKVVGIACYQVDQDDSMVAEPAVLVEDQYQGVGLGKKLIGKLCQQAIRNGVMRFDIYIHPANFRIMQMIKTSGLHFKCKYRDGLKEIRVWLTPQTDIFNESC